MKLCFHDIYHEMNRFITIDLSSFYLDFVKRCFIYRSCRSSSPSCNATVTTPCIHNKMLSPIIPHTADEIWGYINGVEEESVQLTDLPEYQELPNAKAIEEKWTKFMKIRDDVLKALEEARNEKIIGKSLTAKVSLYVREEEKQLLDSISENVGQILIVSDFEVAGSYDEAPEEALKLEKTAVLVTKAAGETCERCWVVTPDVGKNENHPSLCPRCADIVDEHYSHLINK